MSLQKQLLSQYNELYREDFNPELLERNDDKIIEQLYKLILSCQREQSKLVFKVKSFRVIEDYTEIQRLLHNYEESTIKGKNKKKINTYDYINLKDTDMKLVEVVYHIEAKPTKDMPTGMYDLVNYICIPRVVDKYYFKIAGTYYSALQQIIESSTRNNTTSKDSKGSIVIFATKFNSNIRVSCKEISLLTTDDEIIPCENYRINIFSKTFNIFKYYLAKFGLYETLNLIGIGRYVKIVNQSTLSEYDDWYSFKTTNKDIFVCIPKVIYNKDVIVQSLIACICNTIDKNANYIDIFSRDYWLISLGFEFNNATIEKGESLLCSLEGTYDLITKEELKLPEEKKKDIYAVLLWIMQEYKILSVRDNLDLDYKKFGYANYIASLYAMKLMSIIYTLSDLAAKNKLNIERVLKQMRGINPYFLIDKMCKCQLINYKNNVNDLDVLSALKFTYKTISPDDDKKNRNNKKGNKNKPNGITKGTMPLIYKNTHPSHVGRIDMDSSSKTDPGVSGILAPLGDTYDGFFSNEVEPVTWEEEFNQFIKEVDKLYNLQNVLIAKQELIGQDTTEEQQFVACSIGMANYIMQPVNEVANMRVPQFKAIPLEEGGFIYYVR